MASIPHTRKNLLFEAFNSAFSAPSGDVNQNYLMFSDDFRSSLLQQGSTSKTLRDATSHRSNKLSKTRSNGGFSYSANAALEANQRFFRSGPSSEHGGFTFKNNNTNNPSNSKRSKNPFLNNRNHTKDQ
ncbi:hypothetical protein G6F70_004934 [Rhizopus microsporus]|uniref:Uncharacterized protein n=1 Tax=Rhizopus azygosporus TaxID=86630 RepID=A0A367JXW2_RHIAZ|nr:hypothetical protein G6F71_007232 [Rhizopus microsporus]RCH94758.1 hypothetical protein CU097_003613 [Rhizopus azygosporus]KAG1199418.1 hypothetical protein G6F70_004934 [Rhizopus microsporus]KAG1208263.1 hypothetical protein G6F69_007370 [Rhizopus microsporus]KAG1229917.1 hypothetical protein G6F67_006822 [Rhizopus microsporus]